MWILIISLYAHQPLGQVQSKGIIQAPMSSYEVCMQERDRVRSRWSIDGYRIASRCLYVKHYSENNGAYNPENK